MESRPYSLSTAVTVIGILSGFVCIIVGFVLSTVSIYLLLIAIIISALTIISTLIVAFSLQAKAEQLRNEEEILKQCYYISQNLQVLANAHSGAQNTDENNREKTPNAINSTPVSDKQRFASVTVPKIVGNPSWICKNCKEANPSDYKYCAKCGAPRSNE